MVSTFRILEQVISFPGGEGVVSDMQETSKEDMQEEHLKYFIKSTKGGRGWGWKTRKEKEKTFM